MGGSLDYERGTPYRRGFDLAAQVGDIPDEGRGQLPFQPPGEIKLRERDERHVEVFRDLIPRFDH